MTLAIFQRKKKKKMSLILDSLYSQMTEVDSKAPKSGEKRANSFFSYF